MFVAVVFGGVSLLERDRIRKPCCQDEERVAVRERRLMAGLELLVTHAGWVITKLLDMDGLSHTVCGQLDWKTGEQ